MIDLESRCDELCDDQQLLIILRSDSESFDSTDVLDHIENCKRCQQRLDKLAADESDLQKTVSVLASQQDTDDFENSAAANALGPPQSAWAESMARQLLAPATHPELMGRIGRYDVERLIGSGGMGVVFKAHDTELNRPVAIKLLAPYLCGSESARNRFAREARAAAAVVDEHVVPIYNVESDGEHPFLVMKYIAGGSLQQRLDREGPLEVCEVLRIGMQTAEGLAAAHAQGLIHRDVKPSNILLDEGVDRALLTDFGLAHASDDANLTRSGFHPGTPHYMSPEQIRGEVIDARSDLFGLGCVLYSLCTGHPPFCSESSYAVLRRITDDHPESICEINPDTPEWLDQIVMKLLAKSPGDRFASASEVAGVLAGCLAHVQQPASSPLPPEVAATAPKFIHDSSVIRFVAFAAIAVSLFLASAIIVLELNKGTLRIESSAEDVPIQIMEGDKVVQQFTVTSGESSVRIAAGKYVVRIDGHFDGLSVIGDEVSLSRGSVQTVKITRRGKNNSPAAGVHETVSNSDWDQAEQQSGGRHLVIVDIYCGEDVLPQMNTDGPNRIRHTELLKALNAIEGVTTNFRMRGQGNKIFSATVRDPEHQLSQETSAEASRIRNSLQEAFDAAGIDDVRWPRLNPGTGEYEEERVAAYLRSPSPRHELEEAVGKLVLVFHNDEARRAVPCLILDAGGVSFAITSMTAQTVPEGMVPAIDRHIVECGDRFTQRAMYDDRSDKELSVTRLLKHVDTASITDVATPQVGDSVFAVYGDNDRLKTIPVQVVDVGVKKQLVLPERKLVFDYEGLIAVDRILAEGTPVFHDEKLVGITILGERFGDPTTGRSLLIPASRVLEKLQELDAGGMAAGATYE